MNVRTTTTTMEAEAPAQGAPFREVMPVAEQVVHSREHLQAMIGVPIVPVQLRACYSLEDIDAVMHQLEHACKRPLDQASIEDRVKNLASLRSQIARAKTELAAMEAKEGEYVSLHPSEHAARGLHAARKVLLLCLILFSHAILLGYDPGYD